VVLTQDETQTVLSRLKGTHCSLRVCYTVGVRIMEALRLRVKIWNSRGAKSWCVRQGIKDRVTMLPAMLVEPLKVHLKRVKVLHDQDVQRFWRGLPALCAGSQVSECGEEWLAVCVSLEQPFC